MMYDNFCGIYDRLIGEDINYHQICDFIQNIFDIYGISPELVADLACGTGSVTCLMQERGYDMIGIDRSVGMLDIARKKNPDILYLNQDMRTLDLYGTVGAALCMTDGFNYIISDRELFGIFKRLFTCFLDHGGVLIFDISSQYKLEHTLGNNTFVYDSGGIFYVWENRYFPKKQLCDININFFTRNKKGYSRVCERQLQRARSIDRVTALLLNAGFTNINCYSSCNFALPETKSQRLWFTAQKP